MEVLPALVLLGTLFLAFSNGANDNFKGFATVWGSDSLSYRRALALATVATVAGSLASVLLAHGLVQQFSGKGLVPDSMASTRQFMMSVALGAAAAVMTATRVGMPVSTTHALIGALIGAGLASSWSAIDLSALGGNFVMPLLASPVLAAGLGITVYSIVRRVRPEFDCACVVQEQVLPNSGGDIALARSGSRRTLVTAPTEQCDQVPGVALRLSVPTALDRIHILSASAICFARGVNDTPKLAALFVATSAVSTHRSAVLVAIAMGLGGLILARRVAETMSLRINHLDHAQGISANLITAILVIFASKWGMPVSTTHVSVGSISGVGARAGTLEWPALQTVLLSWVATLPFAAASAWAAAMLLSLAGYQ